MRKLILFLLCLLSFNVLAASKEPLIKIQHWQTRGAGVYFVRTPNLPMLDIRVVFAAGSAYDGEEEGLANLTSQMLDEGTRTQTADQIAKAFDDIGAKFDVEVDRDKTTVALRTMTKTPYLDEALTEFKTVLAQANFSNDSLKRIKNQVIAAIKVSLQRPGPIAEIAFYKTIYGSQPYAHSPLGSLATVSKLTQADCQRFYRRYYVARNAKIILVGDLTLAQAKKLSSQMVSSLPEGKHARSLMLARPLNHDIRQHIQFASQQSAIVVGQVGITRKNPDYFPLIVGNYAFGGLPLGSILFEQVRNKRGLAYYAGSVFQPLQYRGPFMIMLKTRQSKTREALDVVRNTLNNFLLEGPNKKQLKAAQRNLTGSFKLSLASNKNIANVVENIAFYNRPLNYLDTFVNNVLAVTPGQVKNAFKKTVLPDKLAVVTVGPQF